MVMQSYVEGGAAQMGTAWDQIGLVPAPPGTSLGDMSAMSLFSELVDSLGLRPIGVASPWATRVSDLEWEEIPRPDTNIALWEINDAAVNAVPQMTFGSPLPFVGIVTRIPMSIAAVRSMWEGTAYAPYETQAIYRQDDAKEPPTILFLHWGERIDMAKLPREVMAIEPKARAASGSMVFAAQVPTDSTTTRSRPATPFSQAMRSQRGAETPQPPAPATPEPIALRPAEEKMNLGVPVAIGLGAMALGFVFWMKR